MPVFFLPYTGLNLKISESVKLELSATKTIKPIVATSWQYAKVELVPPMTGSFFRGPGGQKLEQVVGGFGNGIISFLEQNIKRIDAEELRKVKEKQARLEAEQKAQQAKEAQKKEEEKKRADAAKKAAAAKPSEKKEVKAEKKNAKAEKKPEKKAAAPAKPPEKKPAKAEKPKAPPKDAKKK